MKKVEMSSEAVTKRLRQVNQLREFCLSLMKAKKVSDEKAGLAKKTPVKTTDVEKPIVKESD